MRRADDEDGALALPATSVPTSAPPTPASGAAAPDAPGHGASESATARGRHLVGPVRSVLFTRHTARHVALSLLVVAVFAASGSIEVPAWLFDAALVLHLVGLTVALGAVVVIDWTGLAWIAGLRTLHETLRTAEAATPLVWIGLVLLLVSGLCLAPDLTQLLPWVKMAAVLLLTNNGLVVDHLQARLRQLPRRAATESVPALLRVRMTGSVVASHLGWWTAVVIGVVTMLARR